MDLKNINLKDHVKKLPDSGSIKTDFKRPSMAQDMLSMASALPLKIKLLIAFVVVTLLTGIGTYIYLLIEYSTIRFWTILVILILIVSTIKLIIQKRLIITNQLIRMIKFFMTKKQSVVNNLIIKYNKLFNKKKIIKP